MVWDFPEMPHQARDHTDFPRPLRKCEARLRLADHPLAQRNGAPHGRGEGGGSDPRFYSAGAARGRVSRFTSQFTVNPFPSGVAPSTVIPGGKTEMRTARFQPQKLKTFQAFSTPSFQPCS